MLDYDRIRQPVVLLRVDGEVADDLVYQMGDITIHESNRRLIEATIDFAVLEPGLDFAGTLIEDPRCQPDANWQIQWGYFDDLASDSFRVSHFEPGFGNDGAVIVTLYLTSRGSVATRDTTAYSWGNVQTSDIALAIADRYGLYADVEESDDRRTRDRAYTQPATVTDLQYLLQLAARINFVCYVENDVLHYHRPDTDAAPILELTWYSGEPNSIVTGFKPTIKESRARRSRAASGSGADDSLDGGRSPSHGGYDIDLTTLTGTRFTERHDQTAASTEATTEEDARVRARRAAARQRTMLERANEGVLETVGQPKLRKNRNIILGGVGRQLGGVWHVHESTHTLRSDGTYSTEATLKRGAADVSVRNPPAAPEAVPEGRDGVEVDVNTLSATRFTGRRTQVIDATPNTATEATPESGGPAAETTVTGSTSTTTSRASRRRGSATTTAD